MHNSSADIDKYATYSGHWDLKKDNAKFLLTYAQK